VSSSPGRDGHHGEGIVWSSGASGDATTGRTRKRHSNVGPSKVSLSSVAAFVGLIAVVLAGSIWTGLAVAQGSSTATAVRFGLSIAGGLYYLTLYRLAIGRRFFLP